jgi:spore cortex biosynthesis protein YabQ
MLRGGDAVSLQTQYLTLIAMSLSGAVLGAVYDVYRVVLKHWRFLRFLGPVLDFVFWLFALILVFWALMWANNGDIRLYVFVLLLMGLFIYRLLFRKIVVSGTISVILGIKALVLFLYRLFLLLVVRPLFLLGRFMLALLGVLDRVARMVETVILWPFQPLLRWLHKGCTWALAPLEKRVAKYRKDFAKAKGFLASLSKWFFNQKDDKEPKDPKG